MTKEKKQVADEILKKIKEYNKSKKNNRKVDSSNICEKDECLKI